MGTAPTVVFGGTGTLSATASSGLAVTFTSSTPTICSVSANIVLSLSVAGTCRIAANQPGANPSNFYGSYAPAPQAIQTFAIAAITRPARRAIFRLPHTSVARHSSFRCLATLAVCRSPSIRRPARNDQHRVDAPARAASED